MNLRKVQKACIVLSVALIFTIISYVAILSTINGLSNLAYISLVAIPGWILILVGSGMAMKQHKYFLAAFIGFILATLISVVDIVLPIAIKDFNVKALQVMVTVTNVAFLFGNLMIVEAVKEAYKEKNDTAGFSTINVLATIFSIVVIADCVMSWINLNPALSYVRLALNVGADVILGIILIKTAKEIAK